MSEAKLIERVKDGEIDAFREIVRIYSPEIRGYLASRITDLHKVDDLLQEIFIAAFWKLKSFDQSKEFGPWLQGIAKNKFKEWLRKISRHKERILGDSVPIIEYLDHHCSSEEPHLLSKLKGCLEKLPEKWKLLIEERYFDKRSVQDIASEGMTSVTAISSSLYRIKEKLRTCMEGKES